MGSHNTIAFAVIIRLESLRGISLGAAPAIVFYREIPGAQVH